MRRRHLLLATPALALLGRLPRAAAADFAATAQAARGQTVYFNAWGGAQEINDYIAWAAGELARRAGVTLVHVKLSDTGEAVARVVAEKAAGRSEGGAVDLVWINGENFRAMKEQGLLYGPFAADLPSFRYVDTKGKPTTLVDFTIPTEGYESPWGMAQLVLFHDSARVPTPPRTLAAIAAWAQGHPGRFTYPAPPNFIGATFVKQVLYGTVTDPARLRQPVAEPEFRKLAEPAFAWLAELRPHLWRGGATYPATGPAQHQLLDDGEVDFSMAFNPAEASTLITQGRLPGTVRSFILDGGTIANTHFLAIPFDAAHKEGAMVTADFLLSPEAQARKQDPKVWGDPTVLDLAALPAEDRARFAALDLGVATLTPSSSRPSCRSPIRAGWTSSRRSGRSASPPEPARSLLLRLAPPLTILLFIGPVATGLLGTALPAFGWLPALGAHEPGLAAWRALAASPGLVHAGTVTLVSGAGSTGLALALALAITAGTHGRRLWRWLPPSLPVLLAVPHLASAVGFAFLIAPSGWLARLVSPWLTGWHQPPDLLTLNDRWGLALAAGLALRETPFLLFAIRAAEAQTDAPRQLRVARSLGYGPAEAWLKIALPQLFPLLRLPLLAVLAFSLSVVDAALVLGPTAPAPLAVELLRLADDPDLARHLPAAAGALLLLILTVASGAAAWSAGALVGRAARGWLSGGPSWWREQALALLGAAAMLTFGLGLLSLLALLAWSLASAWRFPALLPAGLAAASWRWAATGLAAPLGNSLALAATSTALALAMTLACLEHESRSGRPRGARVLWLVYLPLLVPQMSFLFGLQVALVALGLDGSWTALVWTHLVFVLPYVFLMLRHPFLALDPHYAAAARVLGRSKAAVFWRVKLPLLRRPAATAAAVGFTVSLALYLPTLFAGGGRVATLTTETLALAGSADRRLAATAGLVLAMVPLLALAAAAMVPAPIGLRSPGRAATGPAERPLAVLPG